MYNNHDREFDMEFLVDTGEGFVVSEEIERKDWAVDYILLMLSTLNQKSFYSVQDKCRKND